MGRSGKLVVEATLTVESAKKQYSIDLDGDESRRATVAGYQVGDRLETQEDVDYANRGLTLAVQPLIRSKIAEQFGGHKARTSKGVTSTVEEIDL